MIKEDGAGGKTRVDYASQDLSFNYFNQSNNLNSTTVTTNSTGGFSIFQNIQPTAGLKRFTIETENQNGIDDTIYDNDIYNINNRSIGWVGINDSIVDPGQKIQINGSTHNQVTLELEKPDGSYIQRNSINPESDGFFEVDRQVLTRNVLEDYQDLGNYTLRINTSLNGQTSTEKFNLSYRELEYHHDTDYLRRPGEQFTISGSANLTKEDGAGGSETVPFTNGDFNFLYFNGENKLRDTTEPTDGAGEFSVTDEMTSTEGKKYYVIEDVNENGITDLRSDNDLKNSERKNLGLVSIDDFIVNSGEEVKVNGTAYNDVEITFNGSEVSGSPVTPNATTGFFNNTFTVPEIPETSGLGNQTLRVNTTLNGEERSEAFEVSLRGIRFDLNSGYPRRIGPEENFTVSGFAHKYVSNGSGGSEAVDYTGETVTITYRDENGEIQTKTDTTNSTGGFEIRDFESPLNAGDREIVISTINDEDIRHDRVETVKTRIRVENSSTTSPSKRLFKDSNLEQTRFINPTQDVEFSVNTRKSLDFVKRVYANVTLPDGSQKQVELNAKNVLGQRIGSTAEFDSGRTQHLTHAEVLEGVNSDRLRLGYEANSTDELLLNMPMETDSGDIKDVSGKENDGSVSGSVSRQVDGVFSTNATGFSGGSLEIQDSSALNQASSFTVSTWIKTTGTGAIYSRANNAGDNINPELRIESGGLGVMKISNEGTGTTVTTSDTINDGEWHQVTGRYNGTHISIYIDGERQGFKQVNAHPKKFQRNPRIGDSGTFQSRSFDGKIDELKIFNRSLSSERIEKIGSRKGNFTTATISTQSDVRDILKLVNFRGDLNNQEIQAQVLSDYDGDGEFEEKSNQINLSQGTEIRSVSGLGNYSDRFKLKLSFLTSDASESPVLSQIDLKARKEDKIRWSNSRNVESFFDEQYGLYNVDYGAEDYAGNSQDMLLEESNFTVRDIVIKADHKEKIDPGDTVKIEGNATLITGDGNGGKSREDFTGKLNILFEDTIRGNNEVQESVRFEDLSSGERREISVNGTQEPINAEVTFFGRYSGIDESLIWNQSQDWDNYQSRTGTTHSVKQDSSLGNDTLSLGYPSQDLGGNSLQSYYAMDDSSYPLDDSSGSVNFQANGSPEIGAEGILSTDAAELSGSEGFESSESPFSTQGSFTINAWVKPESLPSSSGHLGTGNGDPYTVFSVKDKLTLQIVDGGNVYAETKVDGETYSTNTTSGNVNPGEWTMITLVYNTGDDSFTVSTGQGGDSSSTTVTPAPDLTANKAFIGYRPDIGGNGFNGKIDELRVYQRDGIPFNLRNIAGDKAEQQKITTGKKAFSETVRTDSLVLEADVETNGQRAQVIVQSNQGGTSDPITLSDDRTRYQISGSMADSQQFSLEVEMDSNKTHAPEINELSLIRRFATENPAVDIDEDRDDEANYTGRILPGQSQTVGLENLSRGINRADFSTSNGQFNAEINYTEVLVQNNNPKVNLNSTGQFTTSFDVPSVSGTSIIDYYTTNSRGIQGINQTDLTTSLLFTSSNVSDLENGDKVVDPENRFETNSTLAPHTNPIERMWAVIKTPSGTTYERNLNKSTYSGDIWNFTEKVETIYDREGEYEISLKANDTTGLRELESPQVSFNVTNGTVSAQKSDQIVGLGRQFSVNGTVRQNLTGEKVNATVNITLPVTGETDIVNTDESGFYNTTLKAPESTGDYQINVGSEDEDNITASNSTTINVDDSTSVSVSVPDFKIPIQEVTLDSGVNRSVPINITNEGNTDIRDIEVYAEALPDASETTKILQDRGGRDWRTVNQTYNVSSSSKENVDAVIDVSKASTQADYNLNISTRFKTSGGVTKTTSDEITMSVTLSKLPLFQNNLSVEYEDGYQGNFIPPDGTANLTLENQGTGTAEEIGWTVENQMFREVWIDSFFKAKDGSYARGTGDTVSIFEINGNIPEGTPPGKYSTLLSSYSKNPDRTNSANFTVQVKNSPKWEIVVVPLKDQVDVPPEINASNPIEVGTIELDSREDLFNLTLKNTGNRDLEWEARSQIAQGDDSNLFYANESAVPNHGSETFSSTIDSLPNHQYDIKSPTAQVGYTTEFATDIQTDYSANISIDCVDPSGCGPQEVNIPLHGTVKDPAPKVTDIEVPNITGRGNAVFINGTVSDNAGTTNTEGLKGMNITVTKYLDTKEEEVRVGDQDFNIDSPQGTFSEKIVPSKLGRDLSSNDHKYGIRFKAEDENGNRRVTQEYNFTVRDKADLGLTLNRSDIVLENVTANSGDTTTLSGTVSGGEVDAEDATLTLSIGETDPATADEDNINFTSQDSFINLGEINSGENKSFNAEIKAAENTGFIADYFAGVTPAWTNPDGSSESGTESTSTVSAARNIELGLSGTQTLTVPHNSSTEGQIIVESSGNAPINDINFECIGCSSVLGITDYNQSRFSLESGESEVVGYNISAEKYLEPQTVQIDIKTTSERRTAYLNDTTVSVPEDRAVSLKPQNQSEVIPSNQGVLNVTEISAENTGNVPLEPLSVDNPVDLQFYTGQSQVSAFETDISPGETVDIQTRSDTDEIEPEGTTPYNFTVDPSSSTNLDSFNVANVTLFVQDIGFNQKSQNKTQSIVDGDSIEAVFNLTKSDQAIASGNDVDLALRTSGNSFDISETYDPDSKLWSTEFEAPDIEDGVNHTFNFEVSSSEFRSSIDAAKEVSYKDITPPKFSNLTGEPVTEGENSTIEVNVEDNSNLIGQDVTANIVGPEGSNNQVRLDPVGSTRLSETDSKKWAGEFNATTAEGLYNVTVKATDSAENTGESGSDYFRVFRPLNVSGDAGEPSETTEIRLIDQGGETAETVTPDNGIYNETIKSGSYDEAEIIITEEKVANVDSLSASKINQSPPKFDARINDNLVNVDKEYLSGFGIVSETFENVSGELSFDYSGDIDRVDYQGNLQVMKCENYNISRATPCQSGYETVSKNNTFIDAETRNLYVNDISGFSSYILVEDESSSQSNDLNVNLTGELGDFGNLSELSDLDSILQEVAQNTQDISGGGSNDGGGSSSTGSSGPSPGAGGAGLSELASQLNQSEEDDLAIGNSKISISVQPGQEKSTAISIQNPKSESVDIELESTENIRDMLSYEKQFNLSSGEFRTVRISVNASNNTRLKEYSGFIQIKGGETDRSIPVNIDIVGSENRLLDVTLEPTVDNFRPGKTARLKLSFSNQGFSRAVDAETNVSIVDITDDEVVAKKTQTYAIQTTLDKVVSLKIPEDTDLGTYEARASVGYSNIPGNRSATAVGQVEVQRPFWQRKTLGLGNIYWLGIIIVLIAAGSGGGYWYYRKKKLEAKRSRFEEQVDNDAIPSEAGRTAFVGELSEIGTRAFIDLNDLMTHCLTAGATGAGKSVAAQVIVEEALEQGVNVIVLDPTGQWSGYLDKNENDEFFAFYDDFGMKEGDARSYEGNIRAVDADQDTIDITDIMRPDGDEGSIHVFSMHKLENAELEEYLSDTIQQIFDYNPEEKDELKTLIVYDEAHRVLEKFGGTGRGVKMLERGAREFRKWGTGMLMISQVIDDFPEEVRANIGTQIQMRTEYEGDLDRIERKYGNNITQGVTKADTGTGMLQNSSYNHGRPYFVDFRPVKHSPERLSDEELDKFEKYNRRVDEIEDMISILEDQGEDIFEYQSQLKLVKKNIRKRSFNLVDTYLDELEDDLNDALDL